MRVPVYQVDAFGAGPFTGNPAAVCVLRDWLPDGVLQAIAAQNNLSETAFVVGEAGWYRLRWFTPTVEMDLCGHATLATAFALRLRGDRSSSFRFETRSGEIGVGEVEDGLWELDLPARPPAPCPAVPGGLSAGLDPAPVAVLRGDDYLAVYPPGTDLREVRVDPGLLAGLDLRGVILTAAGSPGDPGADFSSRFFAPSCGIDEDPVTGSAHCALVPYWSGVLGRDRLAARQLSERGGWLRCRNLGERVALAGSCRLYLEGEIDLREA